MAQFRKTSRPLYHQRVVYTQFKKCHGLKFQSVLVPDGSIACLYGPVPAKTHDAKLLREMDCWINWKRSYPLMVTQQYIHYMVIWHMHSRCILLVVFAMWMLEQMRHYKIVSCPP